ncbi:hypothetical protein ACFFRR_010625 [Megaselia abdita]
MANFCFFHNMGIVGRGIRDEPLNLLGINFWDWNRFQDSRNGSVAKFCFSQYGYLWTWNYDRSQEIYWESISGIGIGSKIPEAVPWQIFVFFTIWVSLDGELEMSH